MSKDFELESEEGPTIGDRVNYPFIIGRALLAFILNETRTGDYDEYSVSSAAKTIRSLIPSSMEDDEFREALRNATYLEVVDAREEWCGIRIGKKNDANTQRVERADPHKLLRACVDLLNRNHLLGKTVSTEKMGKLLQDKTGELEESV